jgi:hypothetical protein
MFIRPLLLCGLLIACGGEVASEADSAVSAPDITARSNDVASAQDVVEAPADVSDPPEVTFADAGPDVADVAPSVADVPPVADVPSSEPEVVAVGGGILIFELASEFLDRAGAGARFTDPVQTPPPTAVHGPCVVTDSAPDAPDPAPNFGYDAGEITVTGTDPGVTLTPVDEAAAGTGYASGLSEELESLLPAGGALLTIVGTGGQDIPAFTTYVQVPEPVTLTAPATGLFASVDASSDLTVSWNAGTGDMVLVTLTPLSSTFQPVAGAGLVCTAPGDPGVLTIPTAALSAVKSSGVGTVAIGVTRMRTSAANVELWEVPVAVTRSTGGPVGID